MVAAAALIVEDDLEVVCRVVRQTSRRVVERLRLEVGDDRAPLAVSDRATPPVGGEVAWVRAVIKGHIPAVSLRVHRPGQVRTAACDGTGWPSGNSG